MRTVFLFLPLVFLSCHGGASGDPGDGSTSDDTAGDDDTVGDDDDTAGDDDTGEDVTDPCEGLEVSGLSARVHEDYGTLVVVSWHQDAVATVSVEYSFDEGTWNSTPPVADASGAQEQLLLGVPYDTEVTWRVVNDCGDNGVFTSDETTISTGVRPAGLPIPLAVSGDSSRWDADIDYVFTNLQGRWSVLVDRLGRVVWARETPQTALTLYPRLSYGGDALLIDQGTFWTSFDDGAASQVLRTNIDGSVEVFYDTPGLFIGFTDLPDGTIAWPATGDSTAAINDDTLETLTPAGEQVRIWSCREFMMDMRDGGTRGDYCAANTLSWSEERDSFLWTSFAPEGIIEIDRATGQAVRYFGHLAGAWGFGPSSREFWLPHGSYFTDEGTLLLSSDLSAFGEETIVIEYELDEASETLVEIWSFGEGEGLYGGERGEAQRLPGGNTLQNIGGLECTLREVTPEGDVVWEVDWEAGGLGGSSPVADIYALAP